MPSPDTSKTKSCSKTSIISNISKSTDRKTIQVCSTGASDSCWCSLKRMFALVFTGMFMLTCALLLSASYPSPAYAQQVIYVDDSASGANDGSSWANAYTNLQTAIDNATGSDQIWIAAGTYKPTFERPGASFTSDIAYRKRSFVIPASKDGLKLYGGFSGSETALQQRNPEANRVVLSGDIDPVGVEGSFSPNDDSDDDSSTPATTDHLGGSFRIFGPTTNKKARFLGNAYHVVFLGNGLTRNTVIDGVTITGGMAMEQFLSNQTAEFIGGVQRNYGGGLLCDGCSATLRGVRFQGNYALEFGGGAYVMNGGNPLFVNTVFWGNNEGGSPHRFPENINASFEWYVDMGNSSTFAISDISGFLDSSNGGALRSNGASPELVYVTTYQNTPGVFDNASAGNSLIIENGSTDGVDLNPASSTFLQIISKSSNLVDQGDPGLLPADSEDLDGDGNTSEPLPVDIRGSERIRGAAPDFGAFESPFSNKPKALSGAVAIGESLNIRGAGIDNATAVRINGTPVTSISGTGDGGTDITVTVAEGTTSGLIEVQTPTGTLTSENPVTVVPAAYGPGRALRAGGAVELANEAAFDFTPPQTGSSGFTISLWTKGDFEINKEIFSDQTGWELRASGGKVNVVFWLIRENLGGSKEINRVGQEIDLPNDGRWHHVAAVYRFNSINKGTNTAELYVDGKMEDMTLAGSDPQFNELVDLRLSTNDEPVVISSGAGIDQVRFYGRPLSRSELRTDGATSNSSELDVRRRIHRTFDPTDGLLNGIFSLYRFDSGDSNTAFDFAGLNNGSYRGGAGTEQSTAPIGQDAGGNPIGPNGASLQAGGDPDVLGLYQFGNLGDGVRTGGDPGELFDSALPGGLSERAALTWGGYLENGQSLTDATISYGSITGLSEPVGLLYRLEEGSPWRAADGATKNPDTQTFTLTPQDPAVLSLGEYAVASFPFSDLALTLTPETQVLNAGETATFTATLTNSGPDDVPNVTVNFNGTNLSGLSTSGGTFSGGMWDVGTLAGGASATLTLTATSEAGLSTLRGTLGLNDINNGNNTAQAVVPASPAYGPGQALAFDGTDDDLNLGPDIRLDGRDFTISFWAKRASTGTEQTIISQGGSSEEALQIGFRSDNRFEVNLDRGLVLTDNAVTDTNWHHWAVVVEVIDQARSSMAIYRDGAKVKQGSRFNFYNGVGDLFVGRTSHTNDQHFAGELDQLRIWYGRLSTGDIRASMHQRLAPGDAEASNLLASYRFDEGSGTVAHSAGQGPLAALNGNPQWVPFSSARLGGESDLATSNSNASIGPAGAQLSATDANGDLQVFRYGDASSPLRTENDEGEDLNGLPTSITERSHQTWGVSVPGGRSASATLTLDYSSAVGTATTPEPPVRLIRREAPGKPWEVASGWAKDKAAQTFTSTGTAPTGEYALVTLPFSDLSVNIEPPMPTPSGEDATFTINLTNNGPDTSVSAAVNVSGNAELGTLAAGTPSSGTVSGTTWTLGALAPGQSDTLTVSAPYQGPEPGMLTAAAADDGSSDPQIGNNTGTATVILPPYGPEISLAFDGTDDWLEANPVSAAVSGQTELTMSAWVRPSADGLDKQTVMGFYTGSGDNRNIITYQTDQQKFYYFDNEVDFQFATFSSAPDQWYHVSAAIKPDGSGVFYVNGRQAATFNTSVRPVSSGQFVIGMDLDADTQSDFFNGPIDQVRIWNRALTKVEIQARMHSTIKRSNAAFGDLIASYRFDVGTGTTAFDIAGTSNAAFRGDPQWTSFSGAHIGRESGLAVDGTDAHVGQAGTRLEAANADGPVQLYRYGKADVSLRGSGERGENFGGLPSSVTNRSSLTWGVSVPNGTSPAADLTIKVSGINNMASPLTLIRRDRPGRPWQVATGWDKGADAQTFTHTGTVPTGEYALASMRSSELAVSLETPMPTAPGEDATFRLNITNNGQDATVSAAVELSGNSELGAITAVSNTTGSFSNGTWNLGALPVGQTDTLVVTTPFSGPTPGELTAIAGDADSFDPISTNDTAGVYVITPPYGPEKALAFDGNGDLLNAGSTLNFANRSFSIDFWAKRASTGSDHYIIGHGSGNVGTNESLHVGFESDNEFEFAFFGNDLKAPAFVSTDWHHWAVTYNQDTGDRMIYRDGLMVASDNSTGYKGGISDLLIGRVAFENGRHFDGQIDQVRIWGTALSKNQIQTRMHRTVLPEDALFNELMASYRFDSGAGTTAFDDAGGNHAGFAGDPQWVDVSQARIGQEAATAAIGGSGQSGPENARILVSNVSQHPVQLYRYGASSDGLIPDGQRGDSYTTNLDGRITKRSNIVWGLSVADSAGAQADLSLDYSFVNTVDSVPAQPELLRRGGPGQPWSLAQGWSRDAAAQAFTFSGAVPEGEYALAKLPKLAEGIQGPTPGWRMIGAPGPEARYSDVLSGIWTQGFPGAGNDPGADPNVFFYDEATRSWNPPQDARNLVGTAQNSGINTTGNGALVFVFDGNWPQPLNYTGLRTQGEVTLNLSNTVKTPDDGMQGWHLVANPYPFAIDWEKVTADGLDNVSPVIFVWDANTFEGNGNYRVHFGTPVPSLPGNVAYNGIIPPFQAFWARTATLDGTDGTITFKPSHKAGDGENGTLFKHREESPVDSLAADKQRTLVLAASDSTGAAASTAVLMPQALNPSDSVRAYSQARPVSSEYMRVGFVDEQRAPNDLFARWHEPMQAGGADTLQVGFEASRSGRYQLRLPGLSGWSGTVWLEDRQSGQVVQMQPGQSYTFNYEAPKTRQGKANPAADSTDNNGNELLSQLAQFTEPNTNNSTLAKTGTDSARFLLRVSYGQATSNEEDITELPEQVQLDQNYPNPFNPSTTIQYALPQSGQVRLTVYNVLGREVATLVNERQSAGRHTISFNGRRLASGMYLYRLEAGQKVITRKMMLIK